MAMYFDPFRELDRLAANLLDSQQGPRFMPIDLHKQGDHYILNADLPGIDPGSVDVDVDGQLLTIRAERTARSEEGVKWLAHERPSGSFLFLDDLWELVNLRNTRQHFRDGLFVLDIATFNELAVREAILNAVTHRDYRAAGSVFVRQFGERIEIESPGGFPAGVTADNVLFRQVPRNRLLAETLAKTGLVERSGQGVDRMFETAIREGKPLPDFSQSDAYRVVVALEGTIQDPAFLRFLERVADEGSYSFATADLFVLDHVRHGKPVPPELQARLHRLVENDIVERFGRGRGVKYILSRRFAEFLGDPAMYTRERGLDRATNKELLVRHIELQRKNGSTLSEIAQVVPQLTIAQVRTLLQELKQEQRVHPMGTTRAARWFPGSDTKN